MSDADASASKGRTWFERAVVKTVASYASFSPFVLLGLILILLVHGVADVLHWLGVVNTKPVQNDAEFAVQFLAGIVISLLLVILRALERIANKVEDILHKFDDLAR